MVRDVISVGIIGTMGFRDDRLFESLVLAGKSGEGPVFGDTPEGVIVSKPIYFDFCAKTLVLRTHGQGPDLLHRIENFILAKSNGVLVSLGNQALVASNYDRHRGDILLLKQMVSLVRQKHLPRIYVVNSNHNDELTRMIRRGLELQENETVLSYNYSAPSSLQQAVVVLTNMIGAS